MAERRSIALNSDFTVAVIRATLIRPTRTKLRDRRGRSLLSSATSTVDMCSFGNMPRTFLPVSSMVARCRPEVNASGCDGEPTFFLFLLGGTLDTARAAEEVQEYIMNSDHSGEGQKPAVTFEQTYGSEIPDISSFTNP